jgi:hypothetical protein
MELYDPILVHRVDFSTIISQEGGQRSANDFGSINHGNDFAMEPVSNGQNSIIYGNVL